jgi:UDP-N-acetylglucosamine--N-acetylmuramyl-(pentapeptide) pyrophosphoryl-undecaprenol N-acetylglucosamine transferase
MATIVIASGGTGGHLYPTIAIAEAIRESHPDVRIVFIGTPDRIEAREVPRSGFEFFPIEIKAPGRSVAKLLSFSVQYYKALRRSKEILKEISASAFLGGGAYLSVPVAFAAKRRGIPIALLEINAVIGRANRIISKDASKIFVSYQEAISQFRSVNPAKIEMIGTPVRSNLDKHITMEEGRKHFGLDPARKTLLVFGGSLGARSLNEAMEQSAQKLLDEGLNIIWQTGPSTSSESLREVFSDHSRIYIREFISEMPEAYAASDLVVCRAGASTLAELSTLGKAAILVPYPLAVNDHQTKNADSFHDRGAARVIIDRELPMKFEAEVLSLLGDDLARTQMEQAMLANENLTARTVVAEYLVKQAMAQQAM